MVKWKQCTMDQCPCCRTNKEDKIHILPCDQEAASAKWNEAIKKLQDWMKQEQLDPHLIQLLITGLQAWHNKDYQHSDSPVALWQLRLGWEAALDGWISLTQREHQEVFWAL